MVGCGVVEGEVWVFVFGCYLDLGLCGYYFAVGDVSAVESYVDGRVNFVVGYKERNDKDVVESEFFELVVVGVDFHD